MKHPRGSAGSDLMLFVVFIIALGVIWVSTGGPDRAISRSGPFLGGSPFSEEGAEGIPAVGDRVGTSTEDGSRDFLSRISSGLADLQAGEERSPYAEFVSLSVSTAREEDPNEEYLTIKTSRSLTGTLTISDWRLESSDTNSFLIGPAAGLPASGQINNEFPVAVSANTTVYVVSGRSPVGISFRVNACTGYFEQFQDFEPFLPIECPFPFDELIQASKRFPDYSPSIACNNFVAGIEQCTVYTAPDFGGVDPVCQNIIASDLTYNGCVGLHQNDAGFYKNEWRLYLDQDQELWQKKNERIRLLDEAGRVIDVVSY